MKYMPQDLFNGCALAVAMASYLGADRFSAAEKLEADYERTYADRGMGQKFLEAARQIQLVMPLMFEQPDMDDRKFANACNSLLRAVQKYDVTGKRRSKLFRGALFGGLREPLTDPVGDCSTEIVAYHRLLASGKVDPRALR